MQVTPETVVHVASVVGAFVGAAVGQLMRRRRVERERRAAAKRLELLEQRIARLETPALTPADYRRLHK